MHWNNPKVGGWGGNWLHHLEPHLSYGWMDICTKMPYFGMNAWRIIFWLFSNFFYFDKIFEFNGPGNLYKQLCPSKYATHHLNNKWNKFPWRFFTFGAFWATLMSLSNVANPSPTGCLPYQPIFDYRLPHWFLPMNFDVSLQSNVDSSYCVAH